METAAPRLTIVVPAYQVEPYLAECLDSILTEAGEQVEVVAVTDASPDALPRVGYCYRQRPGEAITKSVSDRHFDVFDQYERMWSWLDAAGAAHEPLRPLLFRLVIDHLLVIAGHDARLPAHRRREFFGWLVGHYRSRRPAGGYPRPGGLAGLKHRLVGRGAYGTYAGLRLGWRLWRDRPGRHRSTGPASLPYPAAPITAKPD